MPLDERVVEFERAAHGRVLRKIGVDRSDGRLFHMLRRRKVRLTRSDVHDVNALLAQLLGLRRSGHGGRGLDSINAFRQPDGMSNGSHYTAHDLFFLDLVCRCADLRSACSTNLSAGSIFSRSFCATSSGTRESILPPSCATSRSSRELM